MTKAAVMYELKRCELESTEGDRESAHSDADDALLKFINDNEIKQAYDNIKKWYA